MKMKLNKRRLIAAGLTWYLLFVSGLAYSGSNSGRLPGLPAPSVVIVGGPTVRIPGISAPTVVQLTGYNTNLPVRWLKAGVLIAGGQNLNITEAGTYTAQINASGDPANPFWIQGGVISIGNLSQSTTLSGPATIDPNVTTQLCFTTNASSYIISRSWLRNGIDDGTSSVCKYPSIPGTYQARVTYLYGTQSSTLTTGSVVINPAISAPSVTVSKTTYDPVSSPPVFTVGNFSSFRDIYWYNGSQYVGRMSSYQISITSPGRYVAMGVLQSGLSVYSPEITITQGTIPAPSITSDGGFELTYQDPVIRLSVSGNYNGGYRWFINNQLIIGQMGNSIDAYVPGNYSVKACAVYSDGHIECRSSEIRTLTGEVMKINYVRKKTALSAGAMTISQLDSWPKEQAARSTSYLDGFARPIQHVQRQNSPAGNDVVQIIGYDAFEREQKKFLPFVSNTQDGRYRYVSAGNPVTLNQFYHLSGDGVPDTDYPFAETSFEASPLNRIAAQGAAGEDWQLASNHTIRFGRTVNKVSDNVLLWKENSQGLVSNEKYPEGSLAVTETTDENNNKTSEFVDKAGNKIMSEVSGESNEKLRTYYVYDDLGKLKYVLPPKIVDMVVSTNSLAINGTTLSEECFVYKYDHRGRLIVKQIPGAEPLYYIYDPWDRVVLSQTGNQRTAQRWSFNKYDVLDRLIMSGEKVIQGDRTLLQQAVDNFYVAASANPQVRYEERGMTIHGYTDRTFPVLGDPLMVNSVTYYDNYDFIQTSGDYSFHPEPSLALLEFCQRVKGLTTGIKNRIFGTGEYITTVNYYDNRYRPVQLVADNQHGGIDRISNQYDFTGRLLKEKKDHDGLENIVTASVNNYDHAGRLTEVLHQINGDPEVLLKAHRFNELGQVIEMNLHQDNSGLFWQSLDYEYNVRGWLSGMNQEPAGEAGVLHDDLYEYSLAYNDLVPGVASTLQYNGNVSTYIETRPFEEDETMMPVRSAYAYHYDKRNQLKDAPYFRLSNPLLNNAYRESTSYDANGNVTALTRNGLVNGVVEIVDELSYTYQGNRLENVNDEGNAVEGFRDDASSSDYSYDRNGNLTRDGNKGISLIHYNSLNLPDSVHYADGRLIIYTYDASGQKLRQQVFNADHSLKLSFDYADDIVYRNDTLEQVGHEEGRLVWESANWTYEYFLKDHLGSIRSTFTTNPQAVTFTAGLEDRDMEEELAEFGNSYANATRYTAQVYNHTPGGAKSLRLSAAGEMDVTGLAKSRKVMPGDRVTVEVYAKYFRQGVEAPTQVNEWILEALCGAFGLSKNSTGEAAKAFQSLSALHDAGLLVHAGKEVDEGAPKAYLNYILFDTGFKVYDFGFDQISTAARETGKGSKHEKLSLSVDVKRAGYIYIYLSNESDMITDVFFDDLSIMHSPSPLVEAITYYPFGMIAGRDHAESATGQRRKFNGKKLMEEEGIDWHDYGARMYDAVIARWNMIDPLAEKYGSWSPYQYVMNNPVKFIDPDGKDVVYYKGGRTDAKTDPALAKKYLRATAEGKRILKEAENNKNIKVYVSFQPVDKFELPRQRGLTLKVADRHLKTDAATGKTKVHMDPDKAMSVYDGLDVTKDVRNGKQVYLVTIQINSEPISTAEALGHELEAHVNGPERNPEGIKMVMDMLNAVAEACSCLPPTTEEDADHHVFGARYSAVYSMDTNTNDGRHPGVPETSDARPGSTASKLQKQLAEWYVRSVISQARK